MEKPAKSNATKYFIDYENEIRECGICGKRKSFSEFSLIQKGNGGKTPRTFCKPCRADRTFRQQQERRMDNRPNDYLQCENEDCNWIWHKRTSEKCLKCFPEVES